MVEEHAGNVHPSETELIPLTAAAGRVLAEPILADRDLPPFPRSTRDGYAVRSSDLSRLPAALESIGEIKAGEDPEKIPSHIGAGQCVSIMTGAPVPQGADAVVMVEYTSQQEHRVQITRGVGTGENVVPAGAEAKRGAVLVARGTRLNDAAIALAASAGQSQLLVYKRPMRGGPDYRRRNRRCRSVSGADADSEFE